MPELIDREGSGVAVCSEAAVEILRHYWSYQGLGWLRSRVVSVLDSAAEGLNRSRDAVG